MELKIQSALTLLKDGFISIPSSIWFAMLIGLIGIIGYWYYSFIYWPHTIGPLKDVPGTKYPLWSRIKLNCYTLMGKRPFYIHNMHRKYGPTVLVAAHMVSFIDKDAVNKIYSTYQFPKADEYKTYNVYQGENVFSTRNREFHAVRRRIIAPAVTNANLDQMESVVYQTGTVGLLNYIEKMRKRYKGEVDIFDGFHRSTVDVICELAFGIGFNTLQNTWMPVIELLKYGSLILATRPVLPFLSFFGDMILSTLIIGLYVIFAFRKPNPDSPTNMIESFMVAKDPETGKTLKRAQVISEAIIVFIGGMDTTAISLSWAIFTILRDRDLYKQIQAEVDKIFPNTDIPIDAETCRTSLPILEAAILEALRLYPCSGEYLPRTAPIGGTKLSGYSIPEKTVVFTAPYAYQRAENNWDRPDEYDHTRWLKEDQTELKSKLMVFSQGPRGCPGRALAWLEMFLLTATLIQKYEMELSPGQNTGEGYKAYFLMKPKSYSLKIKMTPRTTELAH